MFRQVLALFFIVLVQVSQAGACPPALCSYLQGLNASDRTALVELLLDFPNDVRFFDGTREAQVEVDAFEKSWKASLVNPQPDIDFSKSSNSWASALQSFPNFISTSEQPSAQAPKLEVIHNSSDFSAEHSIHDPAKYASERIGDRIVEALKKNDISSLIYGGNAESLNQTMGLPKGAILKLPSMYDSWGLSKAFIPGRYFADGKARFVLLIPPSRQYIQHYAGLFNSLNLRLEKAVLNVSDQRLRRIQLASDFKLMASGLKGPVNAVSLGYYNEMLEEILRLHPKASVQHQKMSQGITATLIESADSSKERPFRYVLLKSDWTIWGESSAFLAEASLNLSPKMFLFMGSAGGIGADTKVYDLSIPKNFELNHQSIPIANQIYRDLSQQTLPAEGIVLGATHGHTNSPIDQTKTYVSKKLGRGIETIDVEQDLIAKVIAQKNANGMQVKFGAINLITDKPSSLHFEWEKGHDLVTINKDSKAAARRLAVSQALGVVDRSTGIRAPLCSDVMMGDAR